MSDFNSIDREHFVIIDANSVVHSSFHAYEPIPDKKGNDQRVLHGLLNHLVDISYRLEKIDYLYLVFDPQDGSLYRKSLYPAYKENRPPTDPDLIRQKINSIKIFEDYLGVPIVSYSGFEADDIIGSMANLMRENYKVTIVSPDKDLMQLVAPYVRQMKKFKNKNGKGYDFLHEDTVYQNLGIYPKQIPDWLCLMGDTVDNLPGLDKVGEKTASNLLKQYVSLEHLLAISHQIENKKLQEKIINAKDTLPLVKKLATIKCDLPIQSHIENALDKAHQIRMHSDYKNKIKKLKDYFGWSDYHTELFF